jgi:predicted phosphodiesterase
MRFALISDLHGNVPAVEAVLADARHQGVDAVICLGDVATLGPHPREILDLLRDCVCLLGNHDEFLLDAQLIHTYTEAPIIVDAVEWCRSELRSSDLAFLAGFQRTFEVGLAGAGTLSLFHGTVRSNMENLLAFTPPDELDAMLAGRRAEVLAGGHTHVPMLRQHRGMWVVNSGSVGMPFREYAFGGPPDLVPGADYAIVEGGPSGIAVNLRHVDVDARRLRTAISGSSMPLAPRLRGIYAGW